MQRIHQYAEALRIAWGSLRSNKTRGFLTTLGIVIGIVGVITTMTAAHGLSNSFKESVSALGSDVLYVSRMPWIMQGNFFEFRNRPNISLKDAGRLDEVLATARAVNPTLHDGKAIKFGSNKMGDVDVIGTTEKHMLVSSAVPEYGRFLNRFDVRFKKPVVVIGTEIHERLFDGADPLNKELKIGRHVFRVIGVMEKQGSAGFFDGPNFDRQVFVPITAFVKAFGAHERDLNLAVKAPVDVSMADFEYQVVGEMRKIRHLKPTEKDDFAINQMDALLGMFNRVMGTVVLVGFLITGISLFVGCIGVTNIMFVSVTERTREIGVRKALGARKRAIMAQFLFESAAICLVGGIVGLGVAYGVTEVINRLLLPASISPGIVVVALGVSALVGIIAGLVPAWRASQLDPIMALRYE